jgi:hypothetical protein
MWQIGCGQKRAFEFSSPFPFFWLGIAIESFEGAPAIKQVPTFEVATPQNQAPNQ